MLTTLSYASLSPIFLASAGEHLEVDVAPVPLLTFGAPLAAGSVTCERMSFRYELDPDRGQRGPGLIECATGAAVAPAVPAVVLNLILTAAPLTLIALTLGPRLALLSIPALLLMIAVPLPSDWDPLDSYRAWFPATRPWLAIWAGAMVTALVAAYVWRELAPSPGRGAPRA